MSEALLPVGRDCDCGFPLVWRYGKQWCAVYGSHPSPVYFRNMGAEYAELVKLCLETPDMSRRGRRNRERRRGLRVVA